MTFVVKVTHPWHKASVSTEYAPREIPVETPEEAVQFFKGEAGPMRLDMSRAVERLADGQELHWQDPETGRTVTARLVDAGDREVVSQGLEALNEETGKSVAAYELDEARWPRCPLGPSTAGSTQRAGSPRSSSSATFDQKGGH